MTKDYKETNTKDTQSGGYGWMFSGIALGLLIGLGMYFYASYTSEKNTTNQSLSPDDANFSNNTEYSADGNSAESSNGENTDNVASSGLQDPDPISVVIENARLEQHDRKRASFSYYAVLPNLELDVNVKPSDRDKKPVPEGTTEAIEKVILKPGMHILQIASFRSEVQARKAQKKLVKKGLQTRIEKRKIKGKIWYRLFAGPTQQENEITGWKALVMKSGFKPLVVKVK